VVAGLCHTKRLADAIDKALAAKLAERSASIQLSREWAREQERRRKRYGRFVTFSELKVAGGLPLAIVASDVTHRALQLFSTNGTPNALVGEAVAASMALPILFKPAHVAHPNYEGALFFDGGFTSNLPAWPYDVQRELDPDLYTLLIEIVDRDQGPLNVRRFQTLLRPFLTLRGLVLTTIFGARRLEVRRTRSISITMDPGIALLQFNLSMIRANKIVTEARRTFRATIDRRVEHRKLYQNVCRGIFEVVQAYTRPTLDLTQRGPDAPCVRITLMKAVAEGAHALRSVWRAASVDRFRRETDDRRLCRLEGSFLGDVWADGVTRFQPLRDDSGTFDPAHLMRDARDARHRYVLKLLWEEARWCVAVKVARFSDTQDPELPWLVVIDSNVPSDRFLFSQADRVALAEFEKSIRTISSKLPQMDLKAETETHRQKNGRRRTRVGA
jgi:NTE family protein